jgi:hypothetical protein
VTLLRIYINRRQNTIIYNSKVIFNSIGFSSTLTNRRTIENLILLVPLLRDNSKLDSRGRNKRNNKYRGRVGGNSKNKSIKNSRRRFNRRKGRSRNRHGNINRALIRRSTEGAKSIL